MPFWIQNDTIIHVKHYLLPHTHTHTYACMYACTCTHAHTHTHHTHKHKHTCSLSLKVRWHKDKIETPCQKEWLLVTHTHTHTHTHKSPKNLHLLIYGWSLSLHITASGCGRLVTRWKKMPCPREMDRLLMCWSPQHGDQPKQVLLLQSIHLSSFQNDSHPKTTLPLTKPPGFSEIPTLSYSQLTKIMMSLCGLVSTLC